MTRWVQTAAFHPFFRGHAHHDSKRREPWVFGEPHTSRMRSAVMARYQLLPLWYTLFHEAHTTGMPVMRALWMEYPEDESVFSTDDEFMVGSSLLVRPITQPGMTTATVYLPGGEQARWYDVQTHKELRGGSHSVSAPVEKIPVYQRGGSIVPRQQRLRRCSSLMTHDPYTLVIALDKNGQASGELYMDDGKTFDYQKGQFHHRRFTYSEGRLVSSDASSGEKGPLRILWSGLQSSVCNSVKDHEGKIISFVFDEETSTPTLRKPGHAVGGDFTITLQSSVSKSPPIVGVKDHVHNRQIHPTQK